MSDVIFDVKSLEVAYGNKTVLNVPSLQIPRGKMVFLLGHSGSGKTTFLETLGLMSNYSINHSSIQFYPSKDNPLQAISYSDIREDEAKKTELRRMYFSFMFQATELFPGFNLAENVALTQIIKNVPQQTAIAEARTRLNQMGIRDKEDHEVHELSGGQIQRAAFARAVASKGLVFFADEPTGNLGDEHAEKVMQDVREYVNESQGHATAIIVTHNTNLALAFGDMIIIVDADHNIADQNILDVSVVEGVRRWTQRGVSGKGLMYDSVIDRSSQPLRILMQSMMDGKIEALPSETKAAVRLGYFERLLHPGIIALWRSISEKINRILAFVPPARPTTKQKAGTDSDEKKYSPVRFFNFFAKRSTRDLSLRRQSNWALVAILGFVFTAIGFSGGSLEVLKMKMEDPFVNWISMDIRQESQLEIPSIVEYLRRDSIRQNFSISSVFPYSRFGLNLLNHVRKGTGTIFGREIQVEDPILGELGKSGNIVSGRSFTSNRDIGLIISKAVADEFGITGDDLFIYLVRDTVQYPIPLRAIMNNLPNQSKFICTPYLLDKWQYDAIDGFKGKSSRLRIFVEGDTANAVAVQKELRHFVSGIDSLVGEFPPIFAKFVPDSTQQPSRPGWILTASFLPELSSASNASLFNAFKATNPSIFREKYLVRALFDYPSSAMDTNFYFNRLSINVSELDRVRPLHDLLMHKYSLEIDIAKVESSENYSLVVKLTTLLSIMIVVICIATVCIFMGYILYVHLYKNRGFIGLLKAMGVPPGVLRSMYVRRLMLSLLYSTCIGFAFATVFGYSTGLRRVLNVWFDMESEYLYFSFSSMVPLLFVAILFAASWISIVLTANRIVKQTPGDLLYDRIK